MTSGGGQLRAGLGEQARDGGGLTARPFVSAHYAQSLDGRIALRGRCTRLSSTEGIDLAHRERAAHDAVLVGSGTVRIDDPRLTVRACHGPNPSPVVLASSLDLPDDARLFQGGTRVLVLGVRGRADPVRAARLRAVGAEVRLVESGPDGLVSLPAALATLHDLGVSQLLVEGGARVLTSFLRAHLVDRVSIEITTKLLGNQGLAALGDLGIGDDMEVPELQEVEVTRLVSGFVLTGRPQRRDAAPVSRRRFAGGNR